MVDGQQHFQGAVLCLCCSSVPVNLHESRAIEGPIDHRQSDGLRFHRLRPNWASLESFGLAPIALVDEPRSVRLWNISVMFRLAV